MDSTIRPVDVISVCNADGQIRPLRFRMENEAHQLVRVDIDEIISCRHIQCVGIEAQVFLCSAFVEGVKWLFELKSAVTVGAY